MSCQKLAALLLVVAICGCSSSSDVDPVGTWSFAGTWGPTSGVMCATPGMTISAEITVSGASPNLTYEGQFADQVVSASMQCNSSTCEMHATETAPPSTFAIDWQLTLAGDGLITGLGSEIDSSNACAQPINNITGSIR